MSPAEIIPGQLYVIKRNGDRVDFNLEKIKAAIKNVFVEVDGEDVAESEVVKKEIEHIALFVQRKLERLYVSGGVTHIEDIQDAVELGLMRNSRHEIAKAYIFYRARRNEVRTQEVPKEELSIETKIENMLDVAVLNAGYSDDEVDLKDVITEAVQGVYNDITDEGLRELVVMALRSNIERGSEYSFIAAQVAIHKSFTDTAEVLDLEDICLDEKKLFRQIIEKGVTLKRYSEQLLDFDLDRLADALDLDRNMNFTYLAYTTLYDRYFVHHNQKRFETPQAMFMRIAMGLALNEEDKNTRAIEFYDILSKMDYMASTPTLFNSGTVHPQLSSCFLTTIPDDLYGIYGCLQDNAMLSKWSGGLGNDWTPVRALNSHIEGTNGKSQGVVPFLKVNNDTAVAVNQCFHGETGVYTQRGLIPIKKVKVGDLVLGATGKYKPVLNTKVYTQSESDPVMVVTSSTGRKNIVTAGHPWYVRLVDAEGVIHYKWMDTSELTPEHAIAIPRPKEVTSDLEWNTISRFKGQINMAIEIGSSAAWEAENQGDIEYLEYKILQAGYAAETHSCEDGTFDVRAILPADPRVLETSSDYIFIQVESVVELKENKPTTVYDLVVEGTESYTTSVGLAHNGGKRKGAFCAYLEVWHLDIEEFLELRKNTGDDRRRTHDMNTANWIPDLFMQRMLTDSDWTLFSPNEVSDLHDLYGTEFNEAYVAYEASAKERGLLHKTVKAKDLWRKMLSMVFETGHPWMTYKDVCNLRSPQQHAGVVHSSNLCCIAKDQRVVTDIGLVTIEELYNSKHKPVVAGRSQTAQASEMLLPRPDAPMVKIVTHQGYTHKVTPDHRVWVIGKGQVEAKDLMVNDRLELQNTCIYGNGDNYDEISHAVNNDFVEGKVSQCVWLANEELQQYYFTKVTHEQVNFEHRSYVEELQILGTNVGRTFQIQELPNGRWLPIYYEDSTINTPYATFSHLEELPNEDAYCLTVDSEDHAWTVNSFITHNTEITLNTSENEIAVCNLGSINLVNHIENGKLNVEKLKTTVNTAVRMLDNVIDISYYPVEKARNSNMLHRPVGLGIMGFHDALYKMGIPYNSEEAVQWADESMELISYHAIMASCQLATERGAYSSYQGSLWSQGILPIDSLEYVAKSRPDGMFLQDRSMKIPAADWARLRQLVMDRGMRNSNVMAIAPTATISNICGVSQSIEPTYKNLYVKSNLSGEFTVINQYLVDRLKAIGLWTKDTIRDLKLYDGELDKIDYIPEDIKMLFRTAFGIEPRFMVDAASRRQKWIDQSQSFNIYIANVNGKLLDKVYTATWLRGLKTTYYLRALSATQAEKSTVESTDLRAVKVNAPVEVVKEQPTKEDFLEGVEGQEAPKACSIDNPDCEACQ